MKTSEKEKLYLNQYDVILPNTYRHVISSHESERVLSVSREREGGGAGGWNSTKLTIQKHLLINFSR